jgi:hypothetical protein
MIALRHAELPQAPKVEAFLRDAWPALGACVEGAGSESGVTGLRVSLPGDGLALAALMPVPIPWSDLDAPARAAEAYWPEAAAALTGHEAHAIVTAQLPGADAIELALFLTQAIAAVTAAADAAVGVYWGDGAVVQQPAAFVAQARQMSREYLPLYLWLGFYGHRAPDGRLSLATHGMGAFALMDVEVVGGPRTAHVMLDRAFNAAHYLLDHGPVLRDNDTFGLSAEERILVRHAPSMTDPSRTVYRLEL